MPNTINAKITVSGGNLPSGYKVEIPVTVDFSDATNEDMQEWALSNRKIALQRVMRNLTPDELEEYANNGLTVYSHECGRKIESREDKIKKLVNAGMERAVAELAVDNPAKLNELMANMNK